MEQLKTIGRELAMGSQGGWGQSREFLDLVKSIGECRSKAEEDRIVLHEIETLKKKIAEPDVPRRKMKEYIIRLVYVEMLGHDASFGYIHAVKMTHDDSLLHKRTGYLAVTLFLNEDHDLIILIVNTIQKDLKSDNYLVVCAALTAVCKLINEETIPAVLPQVVELLGHSKEAVRKKAVMALHRFYQRSPSSVSHLISNFRKRLCDNDPGVMGASLCPLFDLVSSDVNSYKDLLVSFVSILKQVAERRLPKNYDYHQMPAPFIQIRLLKILALLGSGDKRASETMYAVLGDIFRKCETTSNIGNAILYECICTVSSIYPSPKLLQSAAEVTSRFLKSDNHNLKYMGVDALRRLIRVNPDIAEEHQLAVIDCLEDPDDTLKRKTFDLLYKMTKSSNVEVIVDRMIDYMINISDNHYKTEIASRCVELAEQFAPSNQWFIQTMNKVFEHAGDLVNIKVAHNLMRLIAEGFGEDDENADSQLRSSAVESYLRIMAEPKLPSAFLQVICWVLGEYGTADGKYTASCITGKLCDVAEAHSTDDTVKEDLQRYQPHNLISVPLVYETLHSGNYRQISASSSVRKIIAFSFVRISLMYMDFRRIFEGKVLPMLQNRQFSSVPPLLVWLWAGVMTALFWPLHMLGVKLVYSKIHASLGISKAGISGGGSLPLHIDNFFEAIGIRLQNGYGLTETSPVVAARRLEYNVLGTVGHPLRSTEIKIVDLETGSDLPAGRKGIVKVRGPQVMKGYYKNEDATTKVLDKEGWLDTGDIGWIVPSSSTGPSRNCGGMLVLEGRSKDTIVLSTGENVEPSEIEEAAIRSNLIQQIIVLGQDQRRLGALIVPSKEELLLAARKLSQTDELDGDSERKIFSKLIRDELTFWTSECSFQIGPFLLLDEPFTLDNGLLTPTMKIRRDQVVARYSNEIAKLFM